MSSRQVIALLAMAGLTSFTLAIFSIAMLPISGPPSEGPAMYASSLMWLCTMSGLVVAPLLGRRPGSAVAVIGLLVGAYAWVGARTGRYYERAQLDSCSYGTGSGSQWFCGAATLPGVRTAWMYVATMYWLIAVVWTLVWMWRFPNDVAEG